MRPLFFFSLFIAFSFTHAAEPLPAAQELLPKVLARLKWEKDHKVEDRWGYTMRMVREDLDKDGGVKEKTDSLYRSESIDGKPFSRLVERNGQPLTEKDRKEDAEREKKFRKRIADKAGKDSAEGDEGEVNEELLSRYHFQVVGREAINGRSTYVVTFLPKVGVRLPEKKTVDKVFNRLQGKAWIDAANYAIARLDFALTEPTSLKGGLGALRSLDASVTFIAVDGDTYLPQQVKIAAQARQLFTTKNIRQSASYSDFHRLSAEASAKH